jgi:hypothetical protein
MIVDLILSILKRIKKIENPQNKILAKILFALVLISTVVYIILSIVYVLLLVLTTFEKKIKCESEYKMFSIYYLLIIFFDFLLRIFLNPKYKKTIFYEFYNILIIMFFCIGLIFHFLSQSNFLNTLKYECQFVENRYAYIYNLSYAQYIYQFIYYSFISLSLLILLLVNL